MPIPLQRHDHEPAPPLPGQFVKMPGKRPITIQVAQPVVFPDEIIISGPAATGQSEEGTYKRNNQGRHKSAHQFTLSQ